MTSCDTPGTGAARALEVPCQRPGPRDHVRFHLAPGPDRVGGPTRRRWFDAGGRGARARGRRELPARATVDRPAGGASLPLTPELVAEGKHFLQMDGRNVFKWAIQAVTESIEVVLEQAGVTIEDVSLFVLHQANIRIIDHAMKVLSIPRSKVYNNLDRVGNTSAASIPLALDEAYREGRIQRGDLVLMCGFGAGLTWGTGLFRW